MSCPGLYVHIPFCERKCFFCSFAVAVNQDAHADAYLKAIGQEALRYEGAEVMTVYIGGGTPSCLTEEQIGHLFDSLRKRFAIAAAAEITFECNPESVTESKARLLCDCGVTRVSLGIQSMNDRFLEYLGRPHRRNEALRAFSFLRAAGHQNINLDLMYGMEGQFACDLDQDLEEVVGLGSEHVSIYALTLEERSLLFARKVSTPGSGDADLYQRICSYLEAAGLLQYEISNFSRSGYESRHNMSYWQGGEYIGLGMAAHSHLAGRRFWNADTLPRYLQDVARQGHAVCGEEKLSSSERMIETLLFSLRMNRGVDLGLLQERFGLEIAPDKIELIESFIEMGLLEEDGMVLRATTRGRNVLDEISARLV